MTHIFEHFTILVEEPTMVGVYSHMAVCYTKKDAQKIAKLIKDNDSRLRVFIEERTEIK